MIADELIKNIEGLEERSINLRDVKGDHLRTVDALLIGDYSIHRTMDGWSVTHVRTGAGSVIVDTPVEALILIGVILGSGGHELIKDKDETYVTDTSKTPPDVRARCTAAIETLRSWDLNLTNV